jgi:CelD/BcsL family acetyltransferase involved in cellulose biosynthesis
MECSVKKMQNTGKSMQVTAETFETLARCWQAQDSGLRWQSLFVLPPWLKAWWEVFRPEWEECLVSVRDGEELIGIAPLMVSGRIAQFMGSPDICDCFDLVAAPGKEQLFCRALLDYLRSRGISMLDLGPVRPDSAVYIHLAVAAEEAAAPAVCIPENVVLELPLPATWDGFLHLLAAKERHEIRRKLRRLDEAGNWSSRMVYGPDSAHAAMDSFLELFMQNRPDKACFLTEQMASFFRAMGTALAQEGILKLFFLDLDGRPAAAALCFDYNDTMYLYNNGYDRSYSSLSVGLLSKVLSIRQSISLQRKTYDFLKGAEEYKYRLGGRPVQLYRCRIEL